MSLPVEQPRYTIAEYLAREERSAQKHEYHDGEILAMAGGSLRHNIIVGNIYHQLRLKLKGHRCSVYNSETRVRAGRRNTYLYADNLVLCSPPEFDLNDPKQTTIINPTVIIEVLSDSTHLYDRGDKFGMYREIDSLQEFVLVSQHRREIETFLRQNDGTWSFANYSAPQAAVLLRSLGVGLAMDDIYEGVSFPSSSAG